MPSEGLACGFGQYVFDVFFAKRDFVVCQRRVYQEHQAGVAQLDGVCQTLFRSPWRVVEGFFQIDFGAAAMIAADFAGVQFSYHAVTHPAVIEVFGFDEGIVLILHVAHVGGDVVPAYASGCSETFR